MAAGRALGCSRFRRAQCAGFHSVPASLRRLDRIRAARPLPDRPDFTCTVSAGLTFPPPGDTFSDAYGRVDRALYAAKLAGRDGVRVG